MRGRPAAVVICITLSTSCGGGGGPAAPVAPSPTPVTSMGTFTLRGAGYDTVATFTASNGGLVFCRVQAIAGRPYLWVRLAATQAGDGATGPHLDLDFCAHQGSGTQVYDRVHDARRGLSCDAGSTWDAWWHDGPRTFVSSPGAPACVAMLTASDGRVEGRFECRALQSFETPGADTLDVKSGAFTCRFP